MKAFIELILRNWGYTDIDWYHDSQGYYVIVKYQGNIIRENVNDIVSNKLSTENMKENFIKGA